MIRVIDRYLFREHLAPFVLGLGLMTVSLLLDRIYQLADLVITKGVPFALVLPLLGFMLPSFLAHTIPMAVLMSILLAGGRLAADLEVVALRVAGFGPIRLLRPVLLATVLAALTTLTLTVVVIPWANTQFKAQLFRILQTRAAGGINERVFNTVFGNTVIYVEEVSPSQVALRGILVSDERDPALTRIATAREGRVLVDPETRRITLRLIEGAISESEDSPARAAPPASPGSSISGGPAETPARESAPRYRYTAFGIYDMSLTVQTPFTGAPRVEKPEKQLSMVGLVAKIRTAQKPIDAAPYRLELHKRFALPFAALAFALIGFPLAIGSPWRGRSLAVVGSLVILVTYYLVLTALERLALLGTMRAWLAMWLPNLLFAAVGMGLMAWQLAPARTQKLRRLRRALTRRPGGPSQPGVARPLERQLGPSRDSTHLIDRYLVRTYLNYFGLTLLVAATLFIVVDLLNTLDRYVRFKPPIRYILQHLVYRVPAGVHEQLYVVTLVTTILVILTISRYHELTAMKAAGISLYRVSIPILGLALLTAAGAALFQEFMLPALNERGEELDRVKILGLRPRHLRLQERIWFRSTDTRFFRLDLLNPRGRDIRGLTVLEIDRSFRLVNRLDAGRAHWTPDGWMLSDGAFREIGPGGRIQSVPFGLTALDMPEKFDDFTEIQKPVDQMSFTELHAYVRRLQEGGYQVRKYLVELYSKLSFPLAHLVMALVAIPFALQSPRGGRLAGLGIAMALLAGYLLVDRSATAFGRADLLPPLMAAWTANVVFLGLAVALLIRART